MVNFMNSWCLSDGHSLIYSLGIFMKGQLVFIRRSLFGVHTQTIRYKDFSAGRIAKRLFLQEMIKMILCEEVVKVAIFL